MFVTVFTYLSKAGEEDAIIALYEDWEHNYRANVQGYLSGELLRNSENTRQFVVVMRFENQGSAQALQVECEHDGWYQRLMSLTEQAPTRTDYISEWQSR